MLRSIFSPRAVPYWQIAPLAVFAVFFVLPLELTGLTTTVTNPEIYALGTVTTGVSLAVILVSLLLIRGVRRRPEHGAPRRGPTRQCPDGAVCLFRSAPQAGREGAVNQASNAAVSVGAGGGGQAHGPRWRGAAGSPGGPRRR